MPTVSYGFQVKKRTKRLLEALLAYANDELEDSDRLRIKVYWQTEKHLVVKTQVRFLEALTALDPYDGKLNNNQIKEALWRLKDFLEILEDNRPGDQGLHDWHFTLKLWYGRHDKDANLRKFDAEWERRRPEKSKQLAAERLKETEPDAAATHLKQYTRLQDWGEAPDVSIYGRTEELSQLEQWIVQDRCKVVALLGMGGIGKTTLAVALADRIQEQFECLVWRSFKPAPPIQSLLNSLIQVFSRGQETLSSDDIQQGISQLLDCLRQRRCLVILDEAEVILRTSEGKFLSGTGQYREGYEGYGELLRRVGGERHQSCILLTSREKPEEIAAFEGVNLPVRSLPLAGLQPEDAKDIFRDKGFSGSEQGLTELIELYGGNPLALKVITTMVQEVFNGNVAYFLSQNTVVLGDRLRTLLQQQVNRLSDLEKEVIYWLTIEREPVSLSRLRSDLLLPSPRSQLLEALASLERRSLIEKITEASENLFTLQPLVMKYVTEEFVEQALDEIDAVLETQDIKQFKILRNHVVVVSQSPSNPDASPDYRMLTRLKDGLQMMLRNEIEQLGEIIPLLRGKSPLAVGYVGRNLLELFKVLGIDSEANDWQDIPMRS